MPRPQRALDPDQGPVQAFAAALRALRAEAGDPKFALMSRRSGRSKTALSEAVGGRHLPRWETVSGFVDACGGRPEDWRARWEEARDAATTPCVGFRSQPAEGAVLRVTGLACGTATRPIGRDFLTCIIDRIDLVSAGDDEGLRNLFVAA